MMRWLFFCIFAIWGSVALFSCSSQKTLLCIPGATQACLCVGGLSGVQSCNSEGMGWLSCVCTSNNAVEPSTDERTNNTPDSGLEVTPEQPILPEDAREEKKEVPGPTEKQEQPEGACQNGTSISCYSGKPGTQGVGICQEGKKTCANGVWGTCVGENTEQTEVCDGKDNDCNGAIDDKAEKVGTVCQVAGQFGPCAESKFVCNNGTLQCPQTVQPQPTEICGNSIDDDCNGKVDEGCSCAAYKLEPSFQVYPHPEGQGRPVLMWNGTNYGLGWDDQKKLIFTEVSATGVRQGMVHTLTNGGGFQGLLQIGTEYVGIVGRMEIGSLNRPGFIKFNSSGIVMALTHVAGGSDGFSPSNYHGVSWTGQELLRNFTSNGGNNIQRLDSAGKNLGVYPMNQQGASHHALAWNGSEMGFLFASSNVSFLRLTSVAATLGSSVVISSKFGREPAIIWNGKEYGGVWRSPNTTGLYTELYFQTISASGTASPEKNTTILMNPFSSNQVFHEYSMVWGNGEYGIAYLLAERVYFARISASGVLLEQPVLVADTRSSHPWLVWTGKEYALVWDHFGATDKVPQVYMRRIVCK